MEAFRDRGFEVLLLTDPIDEVWVDQVGEFDGKELRSIAKGQVDLETEEQRQEAEKRREEFSGFLEWITGTLAEQVKDVRLSSRLTTSAACLVNDEHDMSPALEKMYRAMGQEMPHVKRILELNPSHPLVTALQTKYGEAPDESTETAELLYGMALLAEGGDLDDPSRFVSLLAGRLERSL